MARQDEIFKERLRKIEKLKKIGVNPYSYSFERKDLCLELWKKHKKLKKGSETKNRTKISGRVMIIRDMGKIIFSTLQDFSGKIQIVLQDKKTPEKTIEFFKKFIDAGDFVGVEGVIFRTERGELSVSVKKLELLSKSLLPLPEKWHGLKDKEERYRKRYLDLIMNPEVKNLFIKKSFFIKNIRDYLIKEGFIEVEIPVLEKIPGGADARPFITHHNTLDIDLYLRISLELYLKRLLVGGYEKVFEIGRVFRNEGMSSEHLQEFTMLEFYVAYKDFNWLMDFTEKMYKEIIKKTFNTLKIKYKGVVIDFGKKWKKVDFTDIVKKYTGINIDNFTTKENLIEEIRKKKLGLEIDNNLGRGRIIDQLYKGYVRPKLIHPCFLVNHPIDISPLAKKHRKLNGKVERFQILIAESEVGNAFSELNNPIEQKERFEEQERLRKKGDEEAQRMDSDFINALEYGMPPATGFGVGIDRLFTILTGVESIRDVVLFPMMKPEEK